MMNLIKVMCVALLMCASSVTNGMCVSEADMRERMALFDAWIKTAKKVSTGHESAMANLDFVIQNAQLAMPVHTDEGLGMIPLYAGVSTQKKLFVVCLTDADASISPAWKQLAEKKDLAAWFVPGDQPFLVLRNNLAMSDLWKGVIMVHESLHVRSFFAGVQETEDQMINRAIDEYFAYAVEFDLLDQIGGKAYHALVKKEAKRIATSKEIGPQYGVHEKRLNTIFGKALSHEEMIVRETTLWLHGYFHHLSAQVPPEKRDTVIINFLHWCYFHRLIA